MTPRRCTRCGGAITMTDGATGAAEAVAGGGIVMVWTCGECNRADERLAQARKAGGRELEDFIGAAPHLAESMEDGTDAPR